MLRWNELNKRVTKAKIKSKTSWVSLLANRDTAGLGF
jgi:hypothetical protein